MKLEKLYSFKSPMQIWRILISESDKLLVETRDVNTKEVFFNCFFLEDGRKIFSDLQFEEKSWIGIESIYKEIIYFHKFPKPDLPHHKEIIAFDLAAQKILWTNTDLSYLFVLKNKVYGYKQGFDERYFYALDYLNGELIEELGNDYKLANSLRAQADSERKWSDYLYPQILSEETENQKIHETINRIINKVEIEGAIEYNTYKDLLFFNYHIKLPEAKFNNNFVVVNLENNQVIFEEVLNNNSSVLFNDSFFLYKNFLFLLREKNEVAIFKVE